MGPKKEAAKKEKVSPSIGDPINLSTWKCVVVMAVERTSSDSFIIKELLGETSTRLRQAVKVINFDTYVMKIVNNFANGELPFGFAYLLNFSPIFQEAIEFVKNKREIPVPLLATVIKALLFFLREENIAKMEKKATGRMDPIKAMAQRPAHFGGANDSKKVNGAAGKNKKPEAGLKMRPPSVTKEETKLLKRGEGAKDDECIDDAPRNGYFNLYVLLTGFYCPDLPLELLRADVPLHGLLCIDMSLSLTKRTSLTRHKLQKHNLKTKPEVIEKFWKSFLDVLWNPSLIHYFKEMVFQVYVPSKLPCDISKLKEFIYREISFLLYDMSDFKRQHCNYLRHMKIWNVEEKEEEKEEMKEARWRYAQDLNDFSNEYVTPPVVLQFMMDAICQNVEVYMGGASTSSFDSYMSKVSDYTLQKQLVSQSVLGKQGSTPLVPMWSQLIEDKNHENYRKLYSKILDLDVKYKLNEGIHFHSHPEKIHYDSITEDSFHFLRNRTCGENMAEALNTQDGVFRLYWKKFKGNGAPKKDNFSVVLDYCFHALLITKVFCPCQALPVVTSSSVRSFPSSSKKTSNFELIENLSEEMRKLHFTVTDCSRSILKSIPYNFKDTTRDFFCHSQYKTISPERLKASSAPEFNVQTKLRPVISFVSEFVFPDGRVCNVEYDVHENLRKFIGDYMSMNVKDFDFVEELNKSKLLSREYDIWDDYNCVDYAYSVLTDSIFVILHNRKDSDDSLHESFNATLRSEIGLRDYFDYILDDESDWLKSQEESYQGLMISATKSARDGDFRDYSDSDFWMNNSIKYQEYSKIITPSKRDIKNGRMKVEEVKEAKISDKSPKKNSLTMPKELVVPSLIFDESEKIYPFEGYNVSSMAVQFSGLKTMYYAGDCNIDVQLTERLYGNQDLGVHINQGGHILHLYSYVCPEPHILPPYTFHVTLKSGVIVAFGRRFVETFEEVEDLVESKTVLGKGKKTSSEMTTIVKKTRRISKEVEDEEFIYEMNLSLPNSLKVEVVRRIVKPCYIKQYYLVKVDSRPESKREISRLFLPNGNLVKMMQNRTVEILKPDASIVTASLDDLAEETSANNFEEAGEQEEIKLPNDELSFRNFEILTSEGYDNQFNHGNLISSTRFPVFQNTDVQSNTVFFRRRDGTNYMLQNDGTLCIQFKDGTKMCSSVFVKENSEDYECYGEVQVEEERKEKEFDEKEEFLFIHKEVIIEHPDYATVIYNTDDRKWKILLPFDTAVTIDSTGTYFVNLDKQTELKIQKDSICMSRYVPEKEFWCRATVDLTVFKNAQREAVYCKVEDSTEKTFIVEASSNCYVRHDGHSTEEEVKTANATEDNPEDLVTLKNFNSHQKVIGGRRLSQDSKYYVVRRDITGFEILHKEDVRKALTDLKAGSVVFTQEISDSEKLRCFVLISPKPEKKSKKSNWEVNTIIPDPKYVPRRIRTNTSSTYGSPPSWMHPFPTKKEKFKIPSNLTCRVFIECRRTELTPALGSLQCLYCEMEEEPEVKYTIIEPGISHVQNYVKKLSDDDENTLKEMYALAAKDILNQKKNSLSLDPKKLDHYLTMSKQHVELKEYHKKAIKCHTVPNYFQHPAGMSWLLVNDLIDNMQVSERERQEVLLRVSFPPSKSTSSTFSNDEIEYNMAWSSEPSYSDLSYRSNISMETAPTILTRGGVCTCKVEAPKPSASAPICRMTDPKSPPSYEESEFLEFPPRVSTFQEEDFDILRKKEFRERRNVPLMTLEDLMSLGLV